MAEEVKEAENTALSGSNCEAGVASVTEGNTELVSWPVEVAIDIILNGTRYCITTKVNEDKSVDLGDLNTEGVVNYEDTNNSRYYSVVNYEDTNNSRYYSVALISTALKGEALHKSGRFDAAVAQCYKTGLWLEKDELVITGDGSYLARNLAREFHDEWYYKGDGSTETYRDEEGYRDSFWAPQWYWDDLYYCENCGCYVESAQYHGDGWCDFCWEEEHRRHVIESYGESHDHNDHPVYFGEYKDAAHFAGFGFELEVDTCEEPDENNDDVASNLCSSCGLEENEMRFAHDGSLNYGFECISEPHTVKDFWSKADKWRKMLKYLSSHGYESHNPGTCGLHIHVSRNMLGNTLSEQSSAIAKIYTFFDMNWDDLAKVSRRRDFGYCDRNSMSATAKYDTKAKTKYEKWRVDATRRSQNHYVALNNGNAHTFEYRLGRGTLNAWSFFSWIDLILTITKNARRITVEKVETNDLISWLGGITESTAKYIYKRGAFRSQMLTLYPNIEWESDLTDSSN